MSLAEGLSAPVPAVRRTEKNAGNAALAGYSEAVAAFGAAGERALPPVSQKFRQHLDDLAARLAPGAPAEAIENVRAGVASEIVRWSESAANYVEEKNDVLKELVMVVARTAEVVAERDTRFCGQFGDLTGRLREIARLGNFAVVRRNLIESANQLTACVSRMTEEGRRTMAELKAQVDGYRSRLEEAERRASIDPLTGLANRGTAESAIAGRIGTGRPFCVMLIDLNNFKQVNDTLGHTAGDDLLKQFAAELRAQFAPSDIVGRWGGDEFIGILDGHIDLALQYHDRIERWGFGQYTLNAGGQTHQVRIQAAVGIAEWNGSESARDLIDRADGELYGAKAGRSEPAPNPA